jgi:outer membrane cobalamin receptor
VRAQAAGYPAVVEEIDVGPNALVFVQIRLPTVPAVLRELLVVAPATGAAASRDARTAADLLALQLPGINANSGVVGRNMGSVLPRGASSLTLGSEPAIFLDGVRMGGGLAQARETLGQIPASNVKSIRVLRGPASAFLQGSATGAIYIETRRGPD